MIDWESVLEVKLETKLDGSLNVRVFVHGLPAGDLGPELTPIIREAIYGYPITAADAETLALVRRAILFTLSYHFREFDTMEELLEVLLFKRSVRT